MPPFYARMMFGLLLFALTPAARAVEPNGALTAGEFQTTVRIDVTHKYWLYLPEGYASDKDAQADDAPARWPLLVFLHGAGERGDDLDQVKTHGPPKLIAAGQQFPMIVVAPQCARGSSWYPDAVADLTRDIMGRYHVDPNRVYLSGLSMGGFGTWATAARHPELFAAVVPICGGGRPEDANQLKQLPIWVFHGAQDSAVPLAASQQMVDALRVLGGNLRYTVYPNAGHDSWTATYDNPALYDWLLAQHR